MQDYFEAWEQQGGEWKAILDSVRAEFDYVASKYGMRVLPVRWDEPSLTLNWSSTGYNRSLHGLIAGPQGQFELVLDGSIWRDVLVGNQRTRQYRHESEVAKVYVGRAIDVEKALPRLRDSLEKVRVHIESMREHDAEVSLEKG